MTDCYYKEVTNKSRKQKKKEKKTWMIELRGTDMEYCLEKSFKNSRWNRLEKNMLDKERHCTSLAVNFYLLCRCFLWPLIAGGTRGNVGSRSISFIFLWYTYTTGGKSFFAKQSFFFYKMLHFQGAASTVIINRWRGGDSGWSSLYMLLRCWEGL